MLINKACKTSIVRPTQDYINRIAHYIPYRTKTLDNIKLNFFPQSKHSQKPIESPFSSCPNDKKHEQNVQVEMDLIKAKALFALDTTNRGLINPFTDKIATPQQSNDLLSFRSIGEQQYYQRIVSFILKNPSVRAPNRKRRLQTFSEKKVNKSRVSQLERDKGLILSAMRKKMQFSKRTGRPIEKPGEQLLELPLAIADSDGNPLKGQKSYATRSLQSRYKTASPPVFPQEFPWKPQCCLVEGMFLINTIPLGSHKSLGEYARFLIRRYILAQFNRGSNEVHVIFDNPGRLQNTPKFFEQSRRDSNAKVALDHCCYQAAQEYLLENGVNSF